MIDYEGSALKLPPKGHCPFGIPLSCEKDKEMNTHSNFANKIMQAAIFAGLLFAVLGGIVTLVFGILDIKIPIIVRILFCIGCFVSAGLNFRTYKRIKKQNKMNGQESV